MMGGHRGWRRRASRSRRCDPFGEALGLAFQIADDVLDVTATTERSERPPAAMPRSRKSTYPSALGVEAARSEGEALVDEGVRALRGGWTPDAATSSGWHGFVAARSVHSF